MIFSLQFLAAVLLDFFIGDPRSLPHPVRGIGFLCEFFEKAYRGIIGSELLAGFFSFISVLASVVVPLVLVFLGLHQLSPICEAVAAVLILYTAIAYRDLRVHSLNVYYALKSKGDLASAREEVGKIVGRDTSELDEQGICRACVETVAENMVDGVVAPLFYGLLFACIPGNGYFLPISMAAVGAYLYKSINTMDSMYGYKNERYQDFGRIAARADDLVNLVPARISGILLVCAALILRLDYRNSLRIFFRDRLKHASPNGGHPEAAVAGALGIQLGGAVSYFGHIIEKPTMGDALKPLAPSHIPATNRLMFVGCLLFLIVTITPVIFAL